MNPARRPLVSWPRGRGWRALTSCEIVRNAQQTKAIGSAEDCDFIGQVIFAVYQIELRRWLSSEPLDVAKGIAALRRALLVVIHGLSPRLKSRGAGASHRPESISRSLSARNVGIAALCRAALHRSLAGK